MIAVVTFDLHGASESEYSTAYDILGRIGLYPLSPEKGLGLPYTTVMGELSVDLDADKLRDFIWASFKAKNLKPIAIFGGILNDWAVRSKK